MGFSLFMQLQLDRDHVKHTEVGVITVNESSVHCFKEIAPGILLVLGHESINGFRVRQLSEEEKEAYIERCTP